LIILDTNVASEPAASRGNERVLAWFDRQLPHSLFLTAITIAELFSGVAVLPEGRRKQALRQALEEIVAEIATPVLPFDRKAAMAYADVWVRAKAQRYTMPIADGQIAAIARVHGFSVATRDVKPFRAAGVAVINPWVDE
jgi:predicted nucleic acid-binding protein